MLETSSSGINTLDRVCAILDVFSDEEHVLTLTEISRRLDLPKSTIHRMLTAMEAHGLINRDPYGRGFQLGYQLLRWGMLAKTSLELRNLALPVMRNLASIIKETVVLSVRYESSAIWVETVESEHPIRIALRTGKPLCLHAGASSKVLWAFLSESEIEKILSTMNLEPLMPNSITDPLRMRAELAQIRQRGYAVSYEETDAGAMGIAAPIYDHLNQPIAGLGMVAPVSRIPAECVPEYASQILASSCDLSRQLGAPVHA